MKFLVQDQGPFFITNVLYKNYFVCLNLYDIFLYSNNLTFKCLLIILNIKYFIATRISMILHQIN